MGQTISQSTFTSATIQLLRKGDDMTRIILDRATKQKRQNLAEPLELCDRAGRVLATLVPRDHPKEIDREPKISRAELRRRMASNEKPHTTKEVQAILEKL